MPDDLFTLFAILCAGYGAFLSFRRSFVTDFKNQMIDSKNPGGIGIESLGRPYKFFARLFIGKQDQWLNVFNPISKESQILMRQNRNSAWQIFMAFALAFIFSLVSWVGRNWNLGAL